MEYEQVDKNYKGKFITQPWGSIKSNQDRTLEEMLAPDYFDPFEVKIAICHDTISDRDHHVVGVYYPVTITKQEALDAVADYKDMYGDIE